MFGNSRSHLLSFVLKLSRITGHYSYRTCNVKTKQLGSCGTLFLQFCRCMSSRIESSKELDKLVTPVFTQASKFTERLAVVDKDGQYTYGDILYRSHQLAQKLGQGRQLEGERVVFLGHNDVSYLITLFAIWMKRAIAVPLCLSHPVSEWQYFIQDSQSSLVLMSSDEGGKGKDLQHVSEQTEVPLCVWRMEDLHQTDTAVGNRDNLAEDGMTLFGQDPMIGRNEAAILIYTSGTTGRPKGVVITHGNIHAQMSGMVEAWGWSSEDVILHVLPLHHVHGVVNVLLTPMSCGATCVMLPGFNAKATWSRLLDRETTPAVNLFMAVPTIYAKLIQEYDSMDRMQQENVKEHCMDNIRLMVSGSAALPEPILERWQEITGHTLLERYGMTEVGMALTNPLHGPRVPGTVGNPFPGVEVLVVRQNDKAEYGYDVIASGNHKSTSVNPAYPEESGELMIRGPNVFREYWNKPEATQQTFTKDGWFKTGDTAVYKDGVYKIVGRTSVDVIKSGAYKISALDIERHLLSHPSITDCAVVGLPDVTWGQIVAAVVVLRGGHDLTLEDMKKWARDKMAPYHIPRILKTLEEMPRNAMGKVNKKELVKLMFPEYLEN